MTLVRCGIQSTCCRTMALWVLCFLLVLAFAPTAPCAGIDTEVEVVPSVAHIGEVFEIRVRGAVAGELDPDWVRTVEGLGFEQAGAVESTALGNDGRVALRIPLRAFVVGTQRLDPPVLITDDFGRVTVQPDPVVVAIESVLSAPDQALQQSKIVFPDVQQGSIWLAVMASLIGSVLAFRLGRRMLGAPVTGEWQLIRAFVDMARSHHADDRSGSGSGDPGDHRQRALAGLRELASSGLPNTDPAESYVQMDAILREFLMHDLGLVARARTTSEYARLIRLRCPESKTRVLEGMLLRFDSVKYAGEIPPVSDAVRMCKGMISLISGGSAGL